MTAREKASIYRVMADIKEDKPLRTYATGGGNATASGVTFQASVGASFAVSGLAESPIDSRLGLGQAVPVALRFETEAPVDDVLVELSSGGWVFVQGKNSLSSSEATDSELGKTCDEFIRLWELATKGNGQHGWDRSLRAGSDALLIAVGPQTSGTIKYDLASALDKNRSGALLTLTDTEKAILDRFRKLVQDVIAGRGDRAAGIDVEDVLPFVFVFPYDFGGPDRTAATAWLTNVLVQPSAAPAAFALLETECARRMSARDGSSIKGFRALLASGGVAVKAPPQFESDIQTMRQRTLEVASRLAEFEKTRSGSDNLTIKREASSAVVNAATTGSLVLIGDPGVGKSAIINDAARQMQAAGNEVVLLAVDQLDVETQEGLSGHLGLLHPLVTVLANWPGAGPAYLFLDALDAIRFAKSETLIRNIMREVMKLEGGRWRVVASIRTFDLLVGNEFKALFRDVPPDSNFVDQRFSSVRHVRVGEWTGVEFAQLLAKIPSLATALELGGAKLADLAHVPFNTQLLVELLSDGTPAEQFGDLRSQAQLMDLYWNRRISPFGNEAVQCLRQTVTVMIDRNRMQARSVDAGAGTAQALDRMQQQGVLVSTNSGRHVAFRHHILFDYVAGRVLIDLEDQTSLKDRLKGAGSGLLLAPALSFALQHLWDSSDATRSAFWQGVCGLTGDPSVDPVARIAAARVAAELPTVEDDMKGLLSMLRAHGAYTVFECVKQVVGAMTIRLEDEVDEVVLEPWAYLAEGLAPYVSSVAWPLRTLVATLLDRRDRDAKN
ncbi:hypothetical protein ACQZ6B_06240 [Agrobacterium vitis]